MIELAAFYSGFAVGAYFADESIDGLFWLASRKKEMTGENNYYRGLARDTKMPPAMCNYHPELENK